MLGAPDFEKMHPRGTRFCESAPKMQPGAKIAVVRLLDFYYYLTTNEGCDLQYFEISVEKQDVFTLWGKACKTAHFRAILRNL